VSFHFTKNGNQHVWDAVIEKSPDGTTGKFHLEVTGGWRDVSALLPPAVSAPAAPPYKWFGNEVPETVDAVAFTLEVTPKGDAVNAMTMSGTFDQPQFVPNSLLRVPTHWTYHASVPRVTLDCESHMNLVAGRSTFAGNGTMAVDADTGKEQFTFDAKADEKARAASVALTNVAAKVTLLLRGTQQTPSSRPDVKTTLVSAEDGTKLGDVALDPSRPRFAVVTFTDGTKMDWELYPEGLLPTPAMATAPNDADFETATN
jgi:hypothetical protein